MSYMMREYRCPECDTRAERLEAKDELNPAPWCRGSTDEHNPRQMVPALPAPRGYVK